MFKKKKTYVIIAIIALIIGGYFYSKSKKPKVEYTTEMAVRGNLAQTVSATGTVNLDNQADLSFKTSGRIEQMFVKLGDEVKKGQVIARINRGTLNMELRQAEENIRAQKKVLADMKKRDDTYNKFQEDGQRAVIKKFEAAAVAVKQLLFETSMRAPFDGKILRKNFEVGENVAANTPVIFMGNGRLELELNVPESDIANVSVEQGAEVTFDAFSSEDIFEAKVFEIEPASTVIQDVVYYKVKLSMDNADFRLKPGMSCDTDIKTAEKKDVVMIPLRAVKTENGQKYVEILKDEKNSIVEKISITTGLSGDDGMVEVKTGLNGGEKVITLAK